MDINSELKGAQLEVKDSDYTHNANEKGRLWFNRVANKVKVSLNSAVANLASEGWVTELLNNRIDTNGILADVNHTSIPNQVITSDGFPAATISSAITFTPTGKPVRVLVDNAFDPDNYNINPGLWTYCSTTNTDVKVRGLRVQLLDSSDSSVLAELYRRPNLYRANGAYDGFSKENIFDYGLEFILDSPGSSELTCDLKFQLVIGTGAGKDYTFDFSDINIKAIRI